MKAPVKIYPYSSVPLHAPLCIRPPFLAYSPCNSLPLAISKHLPQPTKIHKKLSLQLPNRLVCMRPRYMQQQLQISEQISKIHLTSPSSWLEVWKASRLALVSDLEPIPGNKSQTKRSLPVIRDSPRESHTPKIRDDGTCKLCWRFLVLHVSGQLRRQSSKIHAGLLGCRTRWSCRLAAAFVPPHAPLRVLCEPERYRVLWYQN